MTHQPCSGIPAFSPPPWGGAPSGARNSHLQQQQQHAFAGDLANMILYQYFIILYYSNIILYYVILYYVRIVVGSSRLQRRSV